MLQHPRPRSRRSAVIPGLVAVAAGLLACCASTHAQEPERIAIDARRCIEIESPDERLACFEAQVEEAIGDERGSSADTPAPAAASAPARVSRPSRAEAPPQTEWVGNISSLQAREPNRYLVTLDNGQVWEQRVAEPYALRVGQRVRIYSTRWGGSQRLEADGLNGFIQVARVR